MSICVDVPIKIGMGSFPNQQYQFQVQSLIGFNMNNFGKQGWTAITSRIMVGWVDDALYSQVICSGDASESILCSNLPGSMFK